MTTDLEFASNPSHPHWESPRSLEPLEMYYQEGGTTNSLLTVMTQRTEVLDT